MVEPSIVYFRNAVTTGEDDVHEEFAIASAERFAEPVRKRQLCFDFIGRQQSGDFRPVGAANEEIQIFCVAIDTGVTDERERAAN